MTPGRRTSSISPCTTGGALALQALRNEIGDESFVEIPKGWPARYAHGNATVGDFVAYAEEVSGESLGALFETWLYQPVKPDAAAAGRGALASAGFAPQGAEVLEEDRGDELRS